jgi:hypothetical protein
MRICSRTMSTPETISLTPCSIWMRALIFGEVEVAGAIDQELHGAGVLKVEQTRNIERGLPERVALRIIQRRRRRLLDQLLVVAQQRALTFAQVDDVAVGSASTCTAR